MKTRLAIVEDQPAIREALHMYLCSQPEFECVAVAGSVEELLEALAAGAPAPRLVLSDIGLPGGQPKQYSLISDWPPACHVCGTHCDPPRASGRHRRAAQDRARQL